MNLACANQKQSSYCTAIHAHLSLRLEGVVHPDLILVRAQTFEHAPHYRFSPKAMLVSRDQV